MIVTTHDHAHHWWEDYECEECHTAVDPDAKSWIHGGGLQCLRWTMDVEKTWRVLICWNCKKRFIALERWGVDPVVYRATETDLQLLVPDKEVLEEL